jgi:hypothetical protein
LVYSTVSQPLGGASIGLRLLCRPPHAHCPPALALAGGAAVAEVAVRAGLCVWALPEAPRAWL